jgi:DNA-binding XRE family transcriptional regulator
MYTVKQIRVGLGYSQDQMAKAIGIHPNTYRNKESQRTQWTVKEAAKIAKLAGQPMEAINF